MKDEVIIVGGGLVGLATARLLSLQHVAVRILDHQPCLASPLSETYELRVSAITRPSVDLFKRLGVWEKICAQRVGEFHTIKVWEENAQEPITFESAQGYIIENKVMQRALMDQASFSVVAPVTIKQIEKMRDNIQIALADGQKFTAKLLIGADGGQSKIREWAQLGVSEKPYGQSALVATVHTQKSHQHIARQRFLSEGPLAFLPLSDAHYCSIVWTNTTHTTEALCAMDERLFNAELNKYFGDELGEIRLESQRLSFPLIKKHAQHYVTERVVLVGDAAHTIHPLAGQGLNLGYLDALALSDVIKQAKQENRDIGLLHTLRRYERARKCDNGMMQNLMDVFNNTRFRKWGVNVVSRSEWLKKIMLLWMEYREKQLCRKSC